MAPIGVRDCRDDRGPILIHTGGPTRRDDGRIVDSRRDSRRQIRPKRISFEFEAIQLTDTAAIRREEQSLDSGRRFRLAAAAREWVLQRDSAREDADLLAQYADLVRDEAKRVTACAA